MVRVEAIDLLLARREIAAHPRVRNVREPVVVEWGTLVEFDLVLDFGDRWLSEGISPYGVSPVETVRFDFTATYPIDPPMPSYRPNLGRNLAHVMPGLTPDDRPVPCLVDGPADDFLVANGLSAYITQFCTWLEGAAAGQLINPIQGWEPIRRDFLAGSAIMDREKIRRLPLTNDHGVQVMMTGYWLSKIDQGNIAQIYEVSDGDDPAAFLPATENNASRSSGTGPAVVLWVPKTQQQAAVHTVYAPDDVSTVRQLMARADFYRVSHRLRDTLQHLNLSRQRHPVILPLIVIFLVKRPCNLIGSDSDIEIISYATTASFGHGRHPLDYDSTVHSLAARDTVNQKLLKRTSGTEGNRAAWIALGAGSLGSKIGLHLGRSGIPPLATVDARPLQSHNVARHGLYPAPGLIQEAWHDYKSFALASVIASMNRVAVLPVQGDIVDKGPAVGALIAAQESPVMLVNTTASLTVREYLARSFPGPVRICDAELYNEASLGVLRVEGRERNPNVGELVSTFYLQAMSSSEIDRSLSARTISGLDIGEGCTSETMICSDAAISLQAALIAEQVDSYLAQPLDVGSITTWLRSPAGVTTQTSTILPFVRVEGGQGWKVSISADIDKEIRDERQRYLPSETGGILWGRISRATRTIYIVGLLPTPKDSERSPQRFVLGVSGVPEAISEISKQSKGRFICVGTWHSHSHDATPSNLDRKTAAELGSNRYIPQAVLILGSDGYQCVIDFGSDTLISQ